MDVWFRVRRMHARVGMKRGRYTLALDAKGATVMEPAGTTEAKADALAHKRYTRLLEQHLRNEARLARSMRAWDKTRAALRRAEKRLDKAWIASAHREADHTEDAGFGD